MKEYYFGMADGSTKKALRLLGSLHIMVNYASKINLPPNNHQKLFVDSGGYSFIFKHNDYPTPIHHYLQHVEKQQADFFANRDYPCAPDVLSRCRRTIKEQQQKTFENQVRITNILEDEFPHLKHKFVGVLQGWRAEDYLDMLDLLKHHGLVTKRIAIGSLCRRYQSQQLRNIINRVRNALPKKIELHGFGVKPSLLHYKDTWDALTSADSQAFRYRLFAGATPVYQQVIEKVNAWKRQLDLLKTIHRQQTSVQNYLD